MNCLVYAGHRLGLTDTAVNALNVVALTRNLHIGDVTNLLGCFPIFRYGEVWNNETETVDTVELIPVKYVKIPMDGRKGILVGKNHAAYWNGTRWFDVNGESGSFEEWEKRYTVASVWLLMMAN